MTRRFLWLVPLLLLVTGAGVSQLHHDTFWLDEIFSLRHAGYIRSDGVPHSQPLSLHNVVLDASISHPNGYYALLAAWGRLAGWSEFSGRALSLLIGVLSIAVIYRAGRDIISPRGGLYAACLLAASAFYFHYLHEMRMYTLLVLLATTSLWAYWRLLQGDTRYPTKIIFVLSLTGMMYTQYLSLLLVISTGLYHLLFARKNHHWLTVTGLALLSGLLYVPWLPYLLAEVNRASSNAGSIDVNVIPTIQVFAQSAAVFSNSYLNRPAMYLFSFFPVFVVLVGAAALKWHRVIRYLLFVALVTSASLLWLSQQIELFIHIRYILVMMPAMLLILGAGMDAINKKSVVAVILSIWVISGWWNYRAYEARYIRDASWSLPWHTINTALAGEILPDDVVFVHTPANHVAWQHQIVANYYTNALPAPTHVLPKQNAQAVEPYQIAVFGYIYGRERVFSVYSPRYPPDTVTMFEDVLARDYTRCPTPLAHSDEIHIDVFALNEAHCSFKTFVD